MWYFNKDMFILGIDVKILTFEVKTSWGLKD